MQNDFAIVVDKRPVKNYWKGRGGFLPVAIVERMIQGTVEDAEMFFDGRKPEGTFAVSAHYAIARDGRVWQFVDDEDTAWSNGVLQNPELSVGWLKEVYQEKVNCNLVTLSIDYEGYSGEPLTPEQYQAALALHRQLVQRWEIEMDEQHIIGHNWIDSLERSQNPGPAFPFEQLLHDLQTSPAETAPDKEATFGGSLPPLTETEAPSPHAVEAAPVSAYQPEAIGEPAYQPHLEAVTFASNPVAEVTEAPVEVDAASAEPVADTQPAPETAQAWQLPESLELTGSAGSPVADAWPEETFEPDFLSDIPPFQFAEEPASATAESAPVPAELTTQSEENPAGAVEEASYQEIPPAIGDIVTPKSHPQVFTYNIAPAEPFSMAEIFDFEKEAPPPAEPSGPAQVAAPAHPAEPTAPAQEVVPLVASTAAAPVEATPRTILPATTAPFETAVPDQQTAAPAEKPKEKHHWYDKLKSLFEKHEEKQEAPAITAFEPAAPPVQAQEVAPPEPPAEMATPQPAQDDTAAATAPAAELEAASEAAPAAEEAVVGAEPAAEEPAGEQAEPAAGEVEAFSEPAIEAEPAIAHETTQAETFTEPAELQTEPAAEAVEIPAEPAPEMETGATGPEEVQAEPVTEAELIEAEPLTGPEETPAEPALEAEPVEAEPAHEAAGAMEAEPAVKAELAPEPAAIEAETLKVAEEIQADLVPEAWTFEPAGPITGDEKTQPQTFAAKEAPATTAEASEVASEAPAAEAEEAPAVTTEEAEAIQAEPAFETKEGQAEPAVDAETGAAETVPMPEEMQAAPVVEAEETPPEPAVEAEEVTSEPAIEAAEVQAAPAIEEETAQPVFASEAPEPEPGPDETEAAAPASAPETIAQPVSEAPTQPQAPTSAPQAESFYPFELDNPPVSDRSIFYTSPAASAPVGDFDNFEYGAGSPAASFERNYSFEQEYDFQDINGPSDYPFELPASETHPPAFQPATEPAAPQPSITAGQVAPVEVAPPLVSPPPSQAESLTDASRATTPERGPHGFAYDDLELPAWLDEPEPELPPIAGPEPSQDKPRPTIPGTTSEFAWAADPYSQDTAVPGWLQKPVEPEASRPDQVAPVAPEAPPMFAPQAPKDAPAVAIPNKDWQDESLFADEDFFSLLNQSGLDLNLPAASPGTSAEPDTEAGPLEPSEEEISRFESLISQSGASQPPGQVAPTKVEPDFDNIFDEIEPSPPPKQTLRQLIDRNDGYTAPLSYEDLDLSVPIDLEEDLTSPGPQKPLVPAQDRKDGPSFGADFFDNEPLPVTAPPPAPAWQDPPGFHRAYLGSGAVSVELANVRSIPSYDKTTILKVAEQGERFEFDGWMEGPELRNSTRWFHIDPADGEGWIHSSLIALDRPFRA